MHLDLFFYCFILIRLKSKLFVLGFLLLQSNPVLSLSFSSSLRELKSITAFLLGNPKEIKPFQRLK